MPNFKKNKSSFMMKGKSSMMKKLVGNQKNIDKNKDGKISKVDFDMMNSPIDIRGKKPVVKNYKKGYYGA
jgi:hypothetical protein